MQSPRYPARRAAGVRSATEIAWHSFPVLQSSTAQVVLSPVILLPIGCGVDYLGFVWNQD